MRRFCRLPSGSGVDGRGLRCLGTVDLNYTDVASIWLLAWYVHRQSATNVSRLHYLSHQNYGLGVSSDVLKFRSPVSGRRLSHRFVW
jgi:hypothetical protein